MDINDMILISGKIAFIGMVIMFLSMIANFSSEKEATAFSKVLAYIGGIICVIGIIAMFSYGIYSKLI